MFLAYLIIVIFNDIHSFFHFLGVVLVGASPFLDFC